MCAQVVVSGEAETEVEVEVVERGMLSCVESTRCRDTEAGASVVATRAEWRVDSGSSNMLVLVKDDWEGEGERGKTGVVGTKTGKVVVVEDDDDDDEEEEECESSELGVGA